MNQQRPITAGAPLPGRDHGASEVYRPPVTRDEDHIDRLYRLVGWIVCLAWLGGGALYAIFAVH